MVLLVCNLMGDLVGIHSFIRCCVSIPFFIKFSQKRIKIKNKTKTCNIDLRENSRFEKLVFLILFIVTK